MGLPAQLQLFSTLFISVLVGVFPFLLLAVLAAGFIEVFVSKEMLGRLIPKNPIIGILTVPFIGFFVPLCECAIVPITGRLINKGVPMGVAIAFMLSNPVLNPFPLIATIWAFPYRPDLVVLRMGMTYVLAVVIGFIISGVYNRRPSLTTHGLTLTPGALGRSIDAKTVLNTASQQIPTFRSKRARTIYSSSTRSRIFLMLYHSGNEFFSIGRFFIVAAFVTTIVHMFVPRATIISLGSNEIASIPTMMGFAYILSLCSEADAFVAASFTTTFSAGSLLAFLLYGPMVDVKNTLIMLAVFKKSLVILLITLITTGVFLTGYLVNILY